METQYKVSLYICPAIVPFSIARHPWFVITNNGKTDRWDLLFRNLQTDSNWGHLFLNYFTPESGIEIFHLTDKFHWKSRLLGSIEGDEGSLAQRMVEFIASSKETYPYRDQYHLFGPNSNTYVQWVLNHFPEFKIKLPWNAFGKNYK